MKIFVRNYSVTFKIMVLTIEELNALEKEASYPTIQDQVKQLEKEISEIEEKLYKLKIKLINL